MPRRTPGKTGRRRGSPPIGVFDRQVFRLLIRRDPGQIVLGDDGGDPLSQAGETAVTDGVLRDIREKALDQIDPATAGTIGVIKT